jgi:hypothetical protein
MSLMGEGETFSLMNHRENILPDGRDSTRTTREVRPRPHKNIFLFAAGCARTTLPFNDYLSYIVYSFS